MFWRTKGLNELTHTQWESLCDGCGKCCLLKLHDEQSDVVYMTSLSCTYLNTKTCRCTDYQNRLRLNPDCILLSKDNIEQHIDILPSTCSYRLVYEGKDLPDWHPLKTGNADSAIETGHSVAVRVTPLNEIAEEDYEDYICDWPN